MHGGKGFIEIQELIRSYLLIDSYELSSESELLQEKL